MSYQIYLSGSTAATLIRAKEAIQEARNFGWDTSSWEKLANRIFLRSGKHPSDAYVLLPRSVLNSLVLEDKHTLVIPRFSYHAETGEFGAANLELPGWIFRGAKAIDPSLDATLNNDGDINSLVTTPVSSFVSDQRQTLLVHFQDVRSRFVESPYEDDYNLLRGVTNDTEDVNTNPANNANYEVPTYYPDTIVAGTTPHTWVEVLTALKTFLPYNTDLDLTGFSYPDLEDPPPDPPEHITSPVNIRTNDRSAWDTICDLLAATGHTLAHDTSTGTIKVVALDSATSTTKTLIDTIAATAHEPTSLLLESRQQTNESKILPETVRVRFPSRTYNVVTPNAVEDIVPQETYETADPYFKDITTLDIVAPEGEDPPDPDPPTVYTDGIYEIFAEGYLYWTTTRYEVSSPDPVNLRQAKLDTLATALATRYLTSMEIPGQEFLIFGGIDVDPDQFYPYIEIDFSQTMGHTCTTRLLSGPAIPPHLSSSQKRAVAGEFPNAKWCYVRPNETIATKESGTAYFLWPTPTWDTDHEELDFSNTTISATVWNATESDLASGVRYLALYDYRIDRWVVSVGQASGTPFTCMIVSTLSGATWDNANKRLTPAANSGAGRLLTWDSANARYATPTTISPEWVDTDTILVASNKARVGKGIFQDGRYQLYSVSCEEVDYTV